MTDEELNALVQRLDAAWEADSLELSTHGAGKIEARINAIPAAQPTVSPDVAALVEAAEAQIQYMDMCHDNGDLERNLRAALARVKGETK